MKRILTAIIASSLVATPAMAHDRSYRNGHRGHDRGSDVVVPIIIGAVLGAVLSSSRDRDYRAYDRNDGRGYYIPSPPAAPEYYNCFDERVVDYRGNIYYRRVCR